MSVATLHKLASHVLLFFPHLLHYGWQHPCIELPWNTDRMAGSYQMSQLVSDGITVSKERWNQMTHWIYTLSGIVHFFIGSHPCFTLRNPQTACVTNTKFPTTPAVVYFSVQLHWQSEWTLVLLVTCSTAWTFGLTFFFPQKECPGYIQ